jgi:hypothetical protein
MWLAMDKSVLDQVPKGDSIKLTFGVRYFVDDPSVFTELVTQTLYFNDLKNKVSAGEPVTAFTVAQCFLVFLLFQALTKLQY